MQFVAAYPNHVLIYIIIPHFSFYLYFSVEKNLSQKNKKHIIFRNKMRPVLVELSGFAAQQGFNFWLIDLMPSRV